MTASLVVALAIVAVLALLMVGAMVRFSRAAIGWSRDGGAREAVRPGRLSPLARWALLYALAWLALIGAFLYLFAVSGEGLTPRNLALLGAVVGGYLGVNALLILFARALIRANRRVAEMVDGEWMAEEGAEPPRAAGAPPAGGEAHAASSAPEPAPEPSPWARARRTLGTVAFLAGVLLVIGVAEAVPALVGLGEWIDARRGPLLLATGLLAGAGFLLFMGSVLHLVLTGGQPMSRAEVGALQARVRLLDLEPRVARGAVGWVAGDAAGARGEETFTLAEVKTAWRARAWQVSPTWRRRFVLLAGVTLLTLGLMGVAVALSPTGLKLVVAGFVLYAAIRTVLALRRA